MKNYILKLRETIMYNKMQDWKRKKKLIIAKQQIKQEKEQLKSHSKKIATSKFLTFFLFGNCTIIEIFSMYAILKGMNMGYGANFGPLETLISTIVAQVISFAIYAIKATKQNTKGGIVYESAMINLESSPIDSDNQEEAVG